MVLRRERYRSLPDYAVRLEGAHRDDDQNQYQQDRDNPTQGRVATPAASGCYIFIHLALLSPAISWPAYRGQPPLFDRGPMIRPAMRPSVAPSVPAMEPLNDP